MRTAGYRGRRVIIQEMADAWHARNQATTYFYSLFVDGKNLARRSALDDTAAHRRLVKALRRVWHAMKP